MKLKYEPASQHYTARCHQTHEEQAFSTEAQALAWAKKVVSTFAADNLTFTVTRVTEHAATLRVHHDNPAPFPS